MSVASVSIYLKNIAGDLFPLDVAPSASLEEIAEQASASHPEPFPPGRTKVLSMEDSKEHEEGEMLLVVVLDSPIMEKGIYPQGGQPYTRWSVSLRGKKHYLYINKFHSPWGKNILEPDYAFGVKENVTKPSESHSGLSTDLWHLVKLYVPDVTPNEMNGLREMVEPYLQQVEQPNNKHPNGREIVQYISKDEPMECGCGSVVKYSGLKSHEKTKKHRTWYAQS